MKMYFKRSTAWMLCLALMIGLFAGVPGAVITKANAAESEATVEAKNLLADFNPSFEEYSIPNWTIDDGVVQYRENTAEDDVWSLQINVKDAAATSDAFTALPYYTYNASVEMLGAGKLAIVFYDAEGNVIAEESAEATTEAWETLTLAAEVPAEAATAVVKLSATTAEAVYFDDAALAMGDIWYAPNVLNAGFETWDPSGAKPTYWIISGGEGYATYNMAEVEGYGKVLNVDNGTADGAATKFQFYSEKFDVMGGLPYIVNMDMFSAAPSSISLYLHVWDNEGNQITSYGVPYDKVREAYVAYNNKLPANEWTTISFCAALPANAAQARILITSNADTTTSDFMFDNAAITVATELYDGGFENAPDAYGVPNGHILHRSHRKVNAYTNTDPAFVKEGKQSYATCGTSYYILSNNVSVLAGETYTASVFVKTTAEQEAAWARNVQYFLYFFDIEGNLLVQKQTTAQATSTGWTEMAMTVVAPAGAVTARTLIAGVGNVAYFDDETFTKVTNATAQNMLANAGFENRATGTRVAAVDWNCPLSAGLTLSDIKYDADKGYVLHWEGIQGPNLQFYTSAVPVTAGKTYTISADFKAVPETVQWIQIYIRYYSAADTSSNKHIAQAMSSINTPNTNEWVTMTKSFEAPEGAAYARVLIAAAGIYGKVDGVTTYGALADFNCDNVVLFENCDHNFSAAPVVTPATCVKDGASVITCSKCGATSTVVTPATGVHTYKSVVTAPTCGAGGFTTNTCTVCGLVTVTDNKPATGAHTPNEGIYTQPTIDADGYTTYTCTTCGTTWVEYDEGSMLAYVVELIRNGVSVGKFLSVSDALANARKGDTLSLLADVNEGFNFPGTNLLGDLTLDGNGFAVKGTIRLQSTSMETLVSNITIKNVVFSGGTYLVISVGNYDGVTIQDCVFENGYITTYANNGLKNVTITGCLFENPTNAHNNASAIIVSATENLTISNNIFLDTQWNAIQVVAASGEVAITGNEINWDVAANVDGAYNLCNFNGAKVTIKDNIVTTGAANANSNIVNVQLSATNTAVYLYDDVSINTALLPDVTEADGYTIYCSGHNFVDGACSVCGFENAADGIVDSGFCGDNLTWTLDAEGTLTISGTGAMKDYGFLSYSPTESTHPWANFASSIKTVVIEDGVTSIGYYAFTYCENLTSVTISGSVTSIGGYAFQGCTSLTSVEIPNNVTSIGTSAFSYCTSLTGITLPNSVTSIKDSAFRGCQSLICVNIGSGITSIGEYAFSGCHNLSRVTYCGTAEQWDAISIAYQSGYLTNVTRSYHDFIGGDCVTNGVCSICGAEKTAGHTVVDGICTVCKKYGICGDNLTWTLDDEGMLTISGTGAMYDFQDDGPLFTAPWYSVHDSIKHVIIESGVTSIGAFAFNGYAPVGTDIIEFACMNLISVDIGDSVAVIGEFAFSGCTSLTNVVIVDSITTIGERAFYECASLASVTFGKNSRLTKIGTYAFANCDALTAICFPASLVSIEAYAFGSCNSLESITFSDNSQLISIGGHAFDNCDSLKTVVLPEGLVNIGGQAFGYCAKLESITIPSTVTSIKTIATGCPSLTGIWVDPNNTAYCNDAYGVLFNKNMTVLLQAPGKLSGIYIIPDGVTTITDAAFAYNDNITGLAIPNSVIQIDDWVFDYCDYLTAVTYCGTEEQWKQISIGSDNDPLTNAARSYHNWVDATCTTAKTCTVCGATEGEIPGHDWIEATCLTAKTCNTCGLVEGAALGHIYNDTYDEDCNTCGDIREVPPKPDENLTIADKGILLGGYIGAQFIPNAEAIAAGGYETVYIVVVIEGSEYMYDISIAEDAYVYEHCVAPKDMGKKMEITVYAVKNGKTYCGNTETWSIKEGILERLATFYPYKDRHEKYMKRCVLLVDMLYYGAAAQVRFNTAADGLITDGLDEKYAALRTQTEPAITAENTPTSTSKNQLYQYNLGLENAVQIQFTFRLATTNYKDYVVKITYGGTTYEYTSLDFVRRGTSGTLAYFVTVVFDKLEAKDMRETVTVELWHQGKLVSNTYTASIEGVATAYIAEGKEKDILLPMMTYGDSATASLNSN